MHTYYVLGIALTNMYLVDIDLFDRSRHEAGVFQQRMSMVSNTTFSLT